MRLSVIAGTVIVLSLTFSNARAQDSAEVQQQSAERVRAIQAALREAGVDGWLFYDFRGSDPLAYRILKLGQRGITTRRPFNVAPAPRSAVNVSSRKGS